MANVTPEQEKKLREFSTHQQTLETLTMVQMRNIERSGLDPKTHALCNLATLVSIDAPLASYAWHTKVAVESGCTVDDFVGVLVAIAPTVGLSRVVAAASKLSVIYDIKIELDEIRRAA